MFIDLVVDACRSDVVRTLFTVRGDFYDRVLEHSTLADTLQGRVVNLGPMTSENLRLAVERPAAEAGLRFEPGLVDLILRDAGEGRGNLPLLEFVLTDLWRERVGAGLMFYEKSKVVFYISVFCGEVLDRVDVGY